MNLDSVITIEVPGERIRGTIVDVVAHNEIIVQLTNLPLSKGHEFKQGDFVRCNLENDVLGRMWVGKCKVKKQDEVIEEVKDDRVRKSYK